MTVPVFVGAGSGVERLTSGALTASKTSCTAGNLLLCHMAVDGTTGDWGGWENGVNIEALDGTDGVFDSLRGGGEFQIAVARVIANGTCSGDVAVGTSGEDVAARIYEISGGSLLTSLAQVFENAGDTSDADSGTSTEVGDAPVTSNGDDRLGINFTWIESAQAMSAFTGESGGDWTEAVAEYVGTSLSLQLQIADMPTATTINGGTFTVGASTPWISVGTALIPAPEPPEEKQSFYTYRRRMVRC